MSTSCVGTMLTRVLNALFPESCPLCNRPSSDHKTAPICRECWQSILPYQGPRCSACGRPLISGASIRCGECITEEPAFASASSFGLYEGALKKAINLLKYHSVTRLSRPLSDILLSIRVPVADAVLPVPLYKKRLRQREFNQSALFAKYVAGSLGVMLILDALVKIRDTKPQVGLSSRERKKNVKNAFRIQKREVIQGKNVLLVDDVSTTGATVRECSHVLKKAGAGEIHVITLAHGIMH